MEKFGDFVLDQVPDNAMLLFEVSIWIGSVKIEFIVTVERFYKFGFVRLLLGRLSCFQIKIDVADDFFLEQILNEFLLSSSELGPPLPGSIPIELFGFWVVLHHFQELVFLQALRNQKLTFSGLIGQLRFQVKEYLVVPKIRVRWQDEKLELIVGSFAKGNVKRYDTVLNHNHFGKTVPIMNDLVLWKVEPGVDVAQKIAGELTSTFEISVIEQIEEILDEVAEQCIN